MHWKFTRKISSTFFYFWGGSPQGGNRNAYNIRLLMLRRLGGSGASGGVPLGSPSGGRTRRITGLLSDVPDKAGAHGHVPVPLWIPFFFG